MNLDVQTIKKLREETGAGVLEVKQALEKYDGDYEKSKAELMEKGLAKAAKKSERVTRDGSIVSYIHNGAKVGSLVNVACETDFVAKTDDFQKLCREIAMQAATEDYESVEDLLNAEYIRDTSKKIKDLIHQKLMQHFLKI